MNLGNLSDRPRAESAALRSMFEARKQVFVDLLKWDLTVLDGQYEVDQFDTSEARYLIAADDNGAHRGSARLLATDSPHILDTLFGGLCARPAPAGPGVFEITRFCLDRRQTATERRMTRNRLVSALVQHALDHKIHTYTGVAHVAWLQQILAFGWRCMPLGPPKQLHSGVIGALQINIDEETPMLLAANGIWIDERGGMPVMEAA